MSERPDHKHPKRRNPSAGVQVQLGQSNIVLLTVTTDKRHAWLASETVHGFLHETWGEARAWLVGDY